MSSPSQPTERERNLKLLADVPPDHLQMLVGIVRSKRSANSGNASNNRPALAPLLKRPSEISSNGGYGSYGPQNKRRALSETGTAPPTIWPTNAPTNAGYMNGTTPFYDPNLPMHTQDFRPINLESTATVPNRGRASSLNGQMGMAFDKTDFPMSNYNVGMSTQTPDPMCGFGGTQAGQMLYSQQQSSYGLTGPLNNCIPTSSPGGMIDPSSAVFSQSAPHSPYIPPSPTKPASLGDNPSLLSAGWQPSLRSHSKSPTPTTNAADACVQGPSPALPGPTMESSSLPDVFKDNTGLGGVEFWGLSASMNNSSFFPYADTVMSACTRSTQQISSTSEPHQSPTEATDVASAMSDLTQQIEALRAENSDLKNRVFKLNSLQQESDKRSQADRDKNNQCRKDIELIYNELQGELRALKESVVTYRGDK